MIRICGDPRTYVQGMVPLDAVDYLLGVIDVLLESRVTARHAVEGWGLTSAKARLAALLYDHMGQTVSKDQLYNAVYYDRVSADDLPSIKIIDVMVSHIRKILPAHIRIETAWGVGYRMIDESAS